MKFSYVLIKKLVPAVKNKQELIEKLNAHYFEADDLGGNVLDIGVPSNRFSDAASHIGIAREISAILGKEFKNSIFAKVFAGKSTDKLNSKFQVEIKDKKLCPRYTAQYFENVKIGVSPKWMQEILIDCGLRPINNVVDIMNYVMLEVGQPLHAFDFDKVGGKKIIVRRANKGEKITALDDKKFDLNENILVIVDEKNALAIAGIKGGKSAEVNKSTKRIIVESANFDGVGIYKTSKFLKLSTDASLRFSHNISSELTMLAMTRAAELLKEISDAKAGQLIDANSVKSAKKIIKFDLARFKKLIGLDLDFIKVSKFLSLLGFKIIKDDRFDISEAFLVEVPALRTDVIEFEDLAEEVIRLYGYNKLKPAAPKIYLEPSGFEDQVVLKDKIRKILASFGLNEVSNYSFIGGNDFKFSSMWKNEAVELENPVSSQFNYLRPSLAPNLVKNINSNFRFFDEIKIFEIGKIFQKDKDKVDEGLSLGIVIASKKNKQTRLPAGQVFFELKGIIEQFFRKIGLVDYLMVEPAAAKAMAGRPEKNGWLEKFTENYLIPQEILRIESGDTPFGYMGRLDKELINGFEGVFAEISLEELLKLVEEEHEYKPLSKYPSVMRDISVLVKRNIKVGEIMQFIQEEDLKYIEDVDLIDEYAQENSNTIGYTFRIVFQAEDRTLTDKEVNLEVEKIEKILKSKFDATIR